MGDLKQQITSIMLQTIKHRAFNFAKGDLGMVIINLVHDTGLCCNLHYVYTQSIKKILLKLLVNLTQSQGHHVLPIHVHLYPFLMPCPCPFLKGRGPRRVLTGHDRLGTLPLREEYGWGMMPLGLSLEGRVWAGQGPLGTLPKGRGIGRT